MGTKTLLFLICICFSCNHPLEKNQSGKAESLKRPASNQKINSFPVCIETERKNAEHPEEPDIIASCIWKNIKFIRTGLADKYGRYSYFFEVYKILSNNKVLKINNSAIFNNLLPEIEKEINVQIAQQLTEMKKEEDEGIKECLLNIEQRSFTIDEMHLFLDQSGKMVFEVDLGLGSSCRPVNIIEIGIPLAKMEKYIGL